MQQGTEEPLSRSSNRSAEENEQVDIGVQTEMSSPVPAQGHDSDRRSIGRRAGVQLTQERVYASRIAFEGGPTACASQRIRAQLVTRGRERSARWNVVELPG